MDYSCATRRGELLKEGDYRDQGFPQKNAVFNVYRSLFRHLLQLLWDIFVITGRLLERMVTPVVGCSGETVIDWHGYPKAGGFSFHFDFVLYGCNFCSPSYHFIAVAWRIALLTSLRTLPCLRESEISIGGLSLRMWTMHLYCRHLDNISACNFTLQLNAHGFTISFLKLFAAWSMTACLSNMARVIFIICRRDVVASSIFRRRLLWNSTGFCVSSSELLRRPCDKACSWSSVLLYSIAAYAGDQSSHPIFNQARNSCNVIPQHQLIYYHPLFSAHRAHCLDRVLIGYFEIGKGAKVYCRSEEARIACIFVGIQATRLRVWLM